MEKTTKATSQINQVVIWGSGFPPVGLPLFLYLFALLGGSCPVERLSGKELEEWTWQQLGSLCPVTQGCTQLVARLYLCENVQVETLG